MASSSTTSVPSLSDPRRPTAKNSDEARRAAQQERAEKLVNSVLEASLFTERMHEVFTGCMRTLLRDGFEGTPDVTTEETAADSMSKSVCLHGTVVDKKTTGQPLRVTVELRLSLLPESAGQAWVLFWASPLSSAVVLGEPLIVLARHEALSIPPHLNCRTIVVEGRSPEAGIELDLAINLAGLDLWNYVGDYWPTPAALQEQMYQFADKLLDAPLR